MGDEFVEFECIILFCCIGLLNCVLIDSIWLKEFERIVWFNLEFGLIIGVVLDCFGWKIYSFLGFWELFGVVVVLFFGVGGLVECFNFLVFLFFDVNSFVGLIVVFLILEIFFEYFIVCFFFFFSSIFFVCLLRIFFFFGGGWKFFFFI